MRPISIKVKVNYRIKHKLLIFNGFVKASKSYKNITNLCKKFCEFPPCHFLTELTTGRQVTRILFFVVRYFTHLNFWLPVMYILIVGLFFHEEAKQTTLLHRQQTDEWKGNVVKDDIFKYLMTTYLMTTYLMKTYLMTTYLISTYLITIYLITTYIFIVDTYLVRITYFAVLSRYCWIDPSWIQSVLLDCQIWIF